MRSFGEPLWDVVLEWQRGDGVWEKRGVQVRARTIWAALKKGMVQLQESGVDVTATRVEVTRGARLEDTTWWKSR